MQEYTPAPETVEPEETNSAPASEIPNICDPADDTICDSCA